MTLYILTQRNISFCEITTRKGRTKYLVSSTKLQFLHVGVEDMSEFKGCNQNSAERRKNISFRQAGGYNTLATTRPLYTCLRLYHRLQLTSKCQSVYRLDQFRAKCEIKKSQSQIHIHLRWTRESRTNRR